MRVSLFTAGALFSAGFAHADPVYTYTGQNFTTVSGAYTTSDHVTGSFTVATPLGDNLSDDTFTPESFSFNDGLQTLTSGNASASTFGVSTDPSGNITNYRIVIVGTSPFFYMFISEDFFDTANDGASLAYNQIAGTFTEQTPATPLSTVTPEPSSIALLSTGLLGAAGIVKRRFA